MSDYVDIKCRDCGKHLGASNWNRMYQEAQLVVEAAPEIGTLARKIAQLRAIPRLRLSYLEPALQIVYEKLIDLDFFAEHADHKLIVMSETGEEVSLYAAGDLCDPETFPENGRK